jgi:hypothetical protein
LQEVRRTKYTVSEVRQRIGKPLAYARGSDQSRDGHGAVASKYDTVFMKRCTNITVLKRNISM